jgi:lysozyme
MLQLLNQGKRKEACHQLMRWVYIGNQQSNGLVNRRRAEAKLCMRDL